MIKLHFQELDSKGHKKLDLEQFLELLAGNSFDTTHRGNLTNF
jgi:hypothetical protein